MENLPVVQARPPRKIALLFGIKNYQNPAIPTLAAPLAEGEPTYFDNMVRLRALRVEVDVKLALLRARVGLYEMLHNPETPPLAVINEALEIARRFSGDGSVEFVNGILDSVLKALPAREPKS